MYQTSRGKGEGHKASVVALVHRGMFVLFFPQFFFYFFFFFRCHLHMAGDERPQKAARQQPMRSVTRAAQRVS